MKPTQKIILDTRHQKKTGHYPVKLRITFHKEQRYYPLGIDMSEENFSSMETISSPKKLDIKLKRKLQDIKFKVEAQSVKANEVINHLSNFSFKVFERKFLTSQHSNDSVYGYYEAAIYQLKKEGRVGTASNYSTSCNSIKRFSPKLLFCDVTKEFLKDYENWLLSKMKSITTVGIYLRPLRAIINQAIEDGSILREEYPFGKRRYQIPASRNKKKALTMDEIRRIEEYEAAPGSWQEKARDFFVFSYFANGINIKDILLLKYEDIDGDYLRYIRAKTSRTNRSFATPITIWLCEDLKEIIKRWGSNRETSGGYIFPVLEKDATPQKQMAVIQQFTKMVNKYLKQIVSKLGIDKPVTTYYARHTFATVLKRNGASPLFISESLGHSSLKTTENYLDSFEDDQRKAILEKLKNYKTAS